MSVYVRTDSAECLHDKPDMSAGQDKRDLPTGWSLDIEIDICDVSEFLGNAFMYLYLRFLQKYLFVLILVGVMLDNHFNFPELYTFLLDFYKKFV